MAALTVQVAMNTMENEIRGGHGTSEAAFLDIFLTVNTCCIRAPIQLLRNCSFAASERTDCKGMIKSTSDTTVLWAAGNYIYNIYMILYVSIGIYMVLYSATGWLAAVLHVQPESPSALLSPRIPLPNQRNVTADAQALSCSLWPRFML